MDSCKANSSPIKAPEISGIFLPLQRFVEECSQIEDIQWKECLSSMAQGNIMEQFPELEKTFTAFMEQYLYLSREKKDGDDIGFNMINDFLDNPVLIYVLNIYIQKLKLKNNNIIADDYNDPILNSILERAQYK